MKDKWVQRWLLHAKLHASFSPCPRGKVGAWIVDPTTNSPISAGYNGTPRGLPGNLCGISVCTRDEQCIKSGTQTEVGCHHAESNALMNALQVGGNVRGAHMVVATPPCLSCAKLIHHAGIDTVHTVHTPQYPKGCEYLLKRGVKVKRHDMPDQSSSLKSRSTEGIHSSTEG